MQALLCALVFVFSRDSNTKLSSGLCFKQDVLQLILRVTNSVAWIAL